MKKPYNFRLLSAITVSVLTLLACYETGAPTYTPVPPTDTLEFTKAPVPLPVRFTLTPTSVNFQFLISQHTLSGDYQLNFNVASDPTADKDKINMPSTLGVKLLQTVFFKNFSGPLPWVDVTGSLDNQTGIFKASGTGTVAGYPGTNVEFDGNITAQGLLQGNYIMFALNGQPTDHSITYAVQGQRTQALVDDILIQEYLGALIPALQTNNAPWLLANLDPNVISTYGQPTCIAHFQQRQPDPSYSGTFISMTGPADWVYAPSGHPQMTIPDVYTVTSNLIEQGKTYNNTQLHFAQAGDALTWFTMCDASPASTATP
jgi:hypothetical protein